MSTSQKPSGTFNHRVKVSCNDIDGLNHTNNACYVAWCEQAAWRHSESLGIGLNEFQNMDRAMAIRHAEYDYALSTYLNDELSIETWLEPESAIKMLRHFEIIRQGDRRIVLTATWHLV